MSGDFVFIQPALEPQKSNYYELSNLARVASVHVGAASIRQYGIYTTNVANLPPQSLCTLYNSRVLAATKCAMVAKLAFDF